MEKKRSDRGKMSESWRFPPELPEFPIHYWVWDGSYVFEAEYFNQKTDFCDGRPCFVLGLETSEQEVFYIDDIKAWMPFCTPEPPE